MVPRIAIAGVAAAVLAGAAGAGTRAAPPFTVTVTPANAAQLRFSYRSGCPVAPAALRNVRLAYWGFDGRRHLGTLVVNRAVVAEVVAAFRRLYRARFPIRRIRPVDAYRGSDERSMAADNTSGFNCRCAVTVRPAAVVGARLRRGDRRQPAREPLRAEREGAAAARRRYADRGNVRPGMAVAGGVLVRRSPPRAGSGAAAGRPRRTTSTSPPPAASQVTRCHEPWRRRIRVPAPPHAAPSDTLSLGRTCLSGHGVADPDRAREAAGDEQDGGDQHRLVEPARERWLPAPEAAIPTTAIATRPATRATALFTPEAMPASPGLRRSAPSSSAARPSATARTRSRAAAAAGRASSRVRSATGRAPAATRPRSAGRPP